MTDLLQAADLATLRWLTPWHSPELDRIMIWISASGGAGLIWLGLGLVAMASPRHRAAAWRVFLTVALSYAVVDGLIKPLIGRERPSITATATPRELPPLPRTSSFPSGHATSTFGAAVAVSRMWPTTRFVWWGLAALIGYSRVYLGHHYPLDIAGGALLGIALAFWVLGGRRRATYADTLPAPLPPDVIVRL